MPLIVLTMICFLACVFLLFVLVRWMRDTKRKTTTRLDVGSEAGETREGKHLYVVGSRTTVDGRDRSKIRARRVSSITKQLSGREPWHDERERIAYERIVRSFRPGKRS
jgi:hypothetical protein